MDPLRFACRIVDTKPVLQRCVAALEKSRSVALDIEAFCTPAEAKATHLGKVSLIQLCAPQEEEVYLVDVLALERDSVRDHLGPLLRAPDITKHMFDCRRDVEALSCQLGIKPRGVLDLQLLHTAAQWKLRGSNRRSGLQYVLKAVCGIERQVGDSAVAAAMTLGNRAVWDVRPLPDHFMEYAADDVRHVVPLAERMSLVHDDLLDGTVRLTAEYVDIFGRGVPLTDEENPDPKPSVVTTALLERYIGPPGRCSVCGQKGHTGAECFRGGAKKKCAHCGEVGHLANSCFKKHPHLLKCDFCGQLGHSAPSCRKKHPCARCGGEHSTESCLAASQ